MRTLQAAILVLAVYFVWNVVHESPGELASRHWTELVDHVNNCNVDGALALLHPDLKVPRGRVAKYCLRQLPGNTVQEKLRSFLERKMPIRFVRRSQRYETLEGGKARVESVIRFGRFGRHQNRGELPAFLRDEEVTVVSTWEEFEDRMLLKEFDVEGLLIRSLP